ncbi:MAG: SDR family NAD(P)-dependent oxidoreductase [Deltaproteobacteria bacterium]|nr:SDR family NAD(P)-dependent oxidoreductase [Deltaproteobacteria bacterium]
MELQERGAIVTGAGTGVGRATALRLAERGCHVAVNYSRSQQEAEQVAAEARQHGVRAMALRADVSQDADCRALVQAALAEFGRLDVLVNNAGTTDFIPHANLEDVKDEHWERILGTNLKGPFQCARAARDALQAHGGGQVVNVSSVAGVYGIGSSIPYCCSKAALNTLTVTLARVLGPAVQVNAVAPGFIDGSWLRGGLGPAFDAVKSAMQDRSLLGKVCTPEDVRDAIFGFLEGSALVTGQVLVVDGGAGISS